jgi:hypothetical protein
VTPQPPSIAHLNGHRLEGLFVSCTNAVCLHSAPVAFAALGLDNVEFPSIAARCFICTGCSAGGERVAGLAQATAVGRPP